MSFAMFSKECEQLLGIHAYKYTAFMNIYVCNFSSSAAGSGRNVYFSKILIYEMKKLNLFYNIININIPLNFHFHFHLSLLFETLEEFCFIRREISVSGLK